MSLLTTHKIDESATDGLVIERCDRTGPSGAYHRYDVTGFDTENNSFSENEQGYAASFSRLPVIFQDGVVPEKGLNGVTLEVLLAIVEDRLDSFQSGPYPCQENAIALEHVRAALETLHQRTRDRMARRVEGKQTT